MAGPKSRFSTYTNGSNESGSKDDAGKKDLWSSMLDSVASGKRLPQKNLLVMGGSVESQKEFIESLARGGSRGNVERQLRSPPIANQFALGYTYYDLLDADHEDTLARISARLLTTASPSFAPLITPLLTPQTIPNTLLVLLLDWSEPWSWLRQVREWMLLLRTVLSSLPDESKIIMEEVMSQWKERGRGGPLNLDGTTAAATAAGEHSVSLPLGPGEWEDALGLPLCVVCQNSEHMESLERTQDWKEEDFDVVMQFMRTVLLKHGGSLIYTTPNSTSQLQTLIHSSLAIQSLLKKQSIKPNVIDRDKVIVPPNWDSWGKIRVLREGFEVESVSQGWSIDLEQTYPPPGRVSSSALAPNTEDAPAVDNGDMQYDTDGYEVLPGSAVTFYEEAIHNPNNDALQRAGSFATSARIDVEVEDTQDFLAAQVKILDAHKEKVEAAQKLEDRKHGKLKPGYLPLREYDDEDRQSANVSEHIGPVQFNVGGIQVDADDMIKRLQDRQTQSSSPELPSTKQGDTVDKEEINPEDLQSFFTNLMNRKGGAK